MFDWHLDSSALGIMLSTLSSIISTIARDDLVQVVLAFKIVKECLSPKHKPLSQSAEPRIARRVEFDPKTLASTDH